MAQPRLGSRALARIPRQAARPARSLRALHEGSRNRLLNRRTMSDPRHPYVAPSLASFGSAEQQELDASGSHEWAVPSYSLPAFAPPASVDAGRAEEQSSLTSRVDRAQLPKVAIPRSANPTTWTSSGRVSRACENCREQKAKCSGHRPTCQRCQEAGVTCSYGDRKREKTAK